MVQTKFNAGMTCGGCSGAVERILNKVDGVTNVVTDLEAKTVVVDHEESVKPEFLLEKLLKWGNASGKEVSLA
eukprot:CAMPEP_0113636490 /NCGR_PEP_ID=MMETSP0017_2-20120614/19051_1 /TAXON_ID=2856 /ORGANISM="Cylindrotheca closterium" /LENGTH=72 /DNA_ID=CAMNT_0000547375 /DNA_START=53 /DNA_END=271 /DNA_ORIENTATION=+ /assembly_acc=CAM_ASM_000147